MGMFDKLLGSGKKPEPRVGAAPELTEKTRAAAEGLVGQGQGLEDAGKFTEAEACFREAIALAPAYPRAHLNLGNVLQQLGRLDECATAYEAAVEADPAFAPAYYNLGVVLMRLGRFAEAKRRLEKALELMPTMAAAAVQLSAVCEREGDLPAAIRNLERAVSLDPRLAQAHADLGALLVKRGSVPEAERAFREALRADARCTLALLGLGRVELSCGNSVEASILFKRACEAKPLDPELWAAYLMSLNVREDLAPEEIASEHFAFGKAFETDAPATITRAAKKGPVRVGYVSGDFKAHPVAWFIEPVLAHHDRDAFETYCYSNVARPDELTARVRAQADCWRPIHGRDDAAVADMIRADKIDVLIDLAGHTSDSRLAVFARRPAPVQAGWLGYLNTSGLRAMDYRITDRHTDPEGMTEALHTEKLVRMPESQWFWVPPYDIPARQFADSPPPRPVTFGSFNHLGKITDACLDKWCEVLRRVPDSLLRIHGVGQPAYSQRLLARLARRGVDEGRVTLIGWLGIHEYFAAFNDVDIALDTMPYNGGTTTFVTYWMGVPMVALAGTRGIARGGYSIAKSAGYEELAALSLEQWTERNVALAKDGAGRLALSRSLRPRLEASPLMDPARFTRDLGNLYRDMLKG